MVDIVVQLSKRASVFAVGEIGIDIHHNQTKKARDNCKLFLDALLTALQQDTVFKTKPLVLHVREAEDGSHPEAAAPQCISALRMARVLREHRIYLHCFVGSQVCGQHVDTKLPRDVWVKASSCCWRVWPRNASGVSESPLLPSDDRHRYSQLEIQSRKPKIHALVYLPDAPVVGSRERADPSWGLGRCGQKLFELL